MMWNKKDEEYMQQALMLAQKAFYENEVPIGALVVYKDNIVGCGYNKVERNKDSFAHAEIEAIKAASLALQTWKLEECVLYVTLEPCLMCFGGLMISRIKKIFYASESHLFAYHLQAFFFDFACRKNTPLIIGGLLKDESQQLLKNFFIKKRKNNE